MPRSGSEPSASHIEECPRYATVIQRQPGISTKSVINEALNTPEILEMILIELDMRTLLTSAQRVCRTWVNMISNSPSIQKALFFTPIKDSEWGENVKMLNPLLTATFSSIFPAKGRLDDYKLNFFDLTMAKGSAMNQFVRRSASWRRMLVQQPPISDIGMFQVYHGMTGDRSVSSIISVNGYIQGSKYNDLRMERLFDLLLFTHMVELSSFSKVRMYWSTEEPIAFDETYYNINDEFHRMISKFGLVLFTREMARRSMGRRGRLSEEEFIKMSLVTAHKDWGFNVNLKKIDIIKSISEVGNLSGVRRQAPPPPPVPARPAPALP